MLFVEAEDFFAQGDILMHGGQGAVHRLDEVVIDDGADVLAVHRHFHTGAVLPRRLIENVLFDVAVIGLRDRVDEVDIGAVIRLEPGFPLFPRSRMEHEAVHAVAHLHLLPVEFTFGQVEVGIVEHGEHGMEAVRKIPRQGENFFFPFAQNVHLGFFDLFQHVIVFRKIGVGDVRL